MNHIELGKKGETLAVNHLVSKDFHILDRNYRWKNSELDIVCKNDEMLIVVEVKTRSTSVFGKPYSSVNRSKQRQLIKVANKYIELKGIKMEVRFDVISIIYNNKDMKLVHIENAFYPLCS